MADNRVYRFEFIGDTKQGLENGVTDVLGSGTQDKAGKEKSDKKSFSDGFTNRVENIAVQQAIISPLNTVTGGLATPAYRLAKSVAKGSSTMGVAFGTFGATIGIIALQKGIEFVQNRLKELEIKVENLNNVDNALIRAGSVSKATYYTSNIFGIKQTTNRS